MHETKWYTTQQRTKYKCESKNLNSPKKSSLTSLNVLVSHALTVPSEEQECKMCTDDGAKNDISLIRPVWPLHSPKYCPVAGE